MQFMEHIYGSDYAYKGVLICSVPLSCQASFKDLQQAASIILAWITLYKFIRDSAMSDQYSDMCDQD